VAQGSRVAPEHLSEKASVTSGALVSALEVTFTVCPLAARE
jgi:hypothetical protein